jgi:hypothetical protein
VHWPDFAFRIVALPSRVVLRGRFVAFSLLVTTVARADPDLQAGGTARVDARVMETQRSSQTDLRGEATVGALLRAAIGHPSFPLVGAAGLDYRIGAAWPTSFAFDANLLPVGLGVIGGRGGMVLVTTGIGVSGVTAGLLPISGQVPLEARLDLDLPGPLCGSLWLRRTWLLASQRQNEVEVGFSLRAGTEDDRYDAVWGSGFTIGTEYVAWGGTQGVTILIGHELDGIFRP